MSEKRVTMKFILEDIKDCGLSQFFTKEGFCSVFENMEVGGYDITISTGVTLCHGEVLREHIGVPTDDVISAIYQKSKG